MLGIGVVAVVHDAGGERLAAQFPPEVVNDELLVRRDEPDAGGAQEILIVSSRRDTGDARVILIVISSRRNTGDARVILIVISSHDAGRPRRRFRHLSLSAFSRWMMPLLWSGFDVLYIVLLYICPSSSTPRGVV
jgi:hypothetical protein